MSVKTGFPVFGDQGNLLNAPLYQNNKINIQGNVYDDTAGAQSRRPFVPRPPGAGLHKVNVTMSLHPLWSGAFCSVQSVLFCAERSVLCRAFCSVKSVLFCEERSVLCRAFCSVQSVLFSEERSVLCRAFCSVQSVLFCAERSVL
ncbi:unnamed protein product [Boreogadus saida]